MMMIPDYKIRISHSACPKRYSKTYRRCIKTVHQLIFFDVNLVEYQINPTQASVLDFAFE
jgi:hypothetical protein